MQARIRGKVGLKWHFLERIRIWLKLELSVWHEERGSHFKSLKWDLAKLGNWGTSKHTVIQDHVPNNYLEGCYLKCLVTHLWRCLDLFFFICLDLGILQSSTSNVPIGVFLDSAVYPALIDSKTYWFTFYSTSKEILIFSRKC